MRYTKGHKGQTRGRIVEAAARLFRRGGYGATGVDGVMAEAGLTAGGFYRHFRSKEQLFGEVLRYAFESSPLRNTEEIDSLEGADFVSAMAGFYLSQEHRDLPEEGCPLPALTSEVARSSPGLRRRFENAVLSWRDEIADHIADPDLSEEARQEIALGVIATLVGGMTLARAFASRSGTQQMLRSAARQAEAGVAVRDLSGARKESLQ